MVEDRITGDAGDTHPDTKRKTVLVVEDSVTQSRRLQILLEGEGLDVMCADNGEKGLNMARELKPDLVLLDLQMPGMNGFQVCQHLKRKRDTADIPIIMLTQHDDPEAVTLGMQIGVVEYIPKDAFRDAVLLETLRQMGIIESRPRSFDDFE